MVVKDTLVLEGRKYYYLPGLYYGADTVRVEEDGNLVYRYGGQEGILYKFNAAVGDTWRVLLPVVNGALDTFTVTLKSRTETVKLHAGTFMNCLRVSFDNPRGKGDEFTHWLAPGVGLVFHCVQEPRGLYEAVVNGVQYPLISSVHRERDNPVLSFTLFQNYPNPFNPETVIRYDLRLRGKVKLRILDILGKEVIELVGEIRQPGSYEVRWDGKDRVGRSVASGTYLCQLTVDQYQISRKILLTR